MMIEYDCIVCGKTVKKSRSPAGMKVIPRFCSQACNGKYRSMNKKGPTSNFKGICEFCGGSFAAYRSPSSKVTPRFCSIVCLGKSQKGENNPAYNGGKYITNGYYNLFMPDHPNRDCKNMVYEHRFVMECKTGRYLKKSEVVHHIDFNKLNNNPDNLMIFDSNSEHMKYHAEIDKGIIK